MRLALQARSEQYVTISSSGSRRRSALPLSATQMEPGMCSASNCHSFILITSLMASPRSSRAFNSSLLIFRTTVVSLREGAAGTTYNF